MVSENTCPVCGYEMREPPRDYNICSSCGTEFGISDVNSSVADLRDAWLESGPAWWSKTEAQPVGWDPVEQMARAGIALKKPVASAETFVSTASSTASIPATAASWVGAAVQQPYGIRREVESR